MNLKTVSLNRFVAKTRTRKNQDFIFIYSIIIPAAVFFGVFYYYPFFYNLYLMFTNYNYINKPSLVGFRNIEKFINDDNAHSAFMNTFIITAAGVPLALVISLLVAIAVFNLRYAKGAIRSAIFSTTLVTGIVSAIVFKLWFGEQIGFINNFLSSINLPKVPWLTETPFALTGIIILGVWGSLGYNMVIFLAGLSNVRRELFEAAKLDGAGAVRSFFSIMLPQLQPTILFLGISLAINFLKSYSQVAFLTQGGPYGSTKTALMYMFEQGFDSRNVGYAAVIAFVLFMVIFAVSVVQLRISKFYAED